MSYQKQTFQSGQVLLASQLNAMDDQIAANEGAIAANAEAISANAEAIAANAEAIGQKVSQEQLTEAVQLAKEGTVSYQNAQALTQEQKQQARQNIGSADGEATEESLGAVRKWIFDSSEVEFVFGHLSTTSDVESNYNKNICFKEKIFSRKGARFYVDEGYKYQISRYKVEDKTAIERVYWMQSDFVYVLEEDCYIRVEISDVNETVQTDLSISEHLHCEMFSDALNVKLAKIRDEIQNLGRVEIDNFTARAIISIGNYSIGETVNMEPEALSYMKVAIVECTEGDQFLICAKGGVGPRVYGFVDGDNRLLSLAEAGTAEKDIERTVTAPENAAKLVINTQDMTAKSYRLDITGKNMKDIGQLRKQMSEKEALEAEQRDDTLKQTSNLVNALGLDAFRGKTMELCAPNQYTAWPFVCGVDGKLVCVYSRGLSHEDNVNPSIFSRVSHNGVIWSAERQIINTAGTRDTITGKGKDENGSMIFWDRKGGPGGGTSVHHLYRTTDGYHFEQVSAPSFSTVPAHVGDIIHVPEHGLMCFFNTAGSPRTWGVLKSQDNGLTWTQEAIEADIEGGDCPVEMSPVYLGEGKILVIGRQDENDNGMFQIQSSDYGETWSKTVTNITGVRYITPSLVYDEAGSALNLYYYDRGTGILKKRTADASSVWDAPTSWPDAVNIATGYGKWQDAGNVNACAFGAIQFAAFYSGNETDTGIYGTII